MLKQPLQGVKTEVHVLGFDIIYYQEEHPLIKSCGLPFVRSALLYPVFRSGVNFMRFAVQIFDKRNLQGKNAVVR